MVICSSISRLFEKAPAAKSLFNRLNVDDFEGPEFSGHIMRVMSGLDMLINYLDDRPALESMLAHLADQHAVRTGVTTAAFDVSTRVVCLTLLNKLIIIFFYFFRFPSQVTIYYSSCTLVKHFIFPCSYTSCMSWVSPFSFSWLLLLHSHLAHTTIIPFKFLTNAV